MSFYDEMADMVSELLAPTSEDGLGQGEIVLINTKAGAPNPEKPWEPVEPVIKKETLKGAVSGISKELIGTEVGGTVLLASDRMAICSVPKMKYTAGDTLTIDGVPAHIISYSKIPAAGVAAAVKFIIKG